MTISRSSMSIKVIGSRSRSRSCVKNDYLLISTCYSFVCTYRPLIRSMSHIKVKVTHQDVSDWLTNNTVDLFVPQNPSWLPDKISIHITET